MNSTPKLLKLDRPSGVYQPGERMSGYFLTDGSHIPPIRELPNCRSCGTRLGKVRKILRSIISSTWSTNPAGLSTYARRESSLPNCRRAR